MRARRDGPPRPGWRLLPHPNRFAPEHPHFDEALRRHERAMASGLSTYRDPATGASVMTADYLVSRGPCCGSGCRHCPWEDGGDTRPVEPR